MAIAIAESTYRLPNTKHIRTTPFKSMFDQGDLSHEERRLKTFLLWPTWGKVDVAKLALAGFYYTGEKDTAKCFECNVEISNWKENESPVAVHKRKSPTCPMVTKERSSNVPLHPEEASGSQSPKGAKGKRKGKKNPSGQDGTDSYSTLASDSVPIYNSTGTGASVFHSRPAPSAMSSKAAEASGYTDMTKEENRLRSFEGKWPKSDIIKPLQMAKAGFWYKGPHDRVECAYCRGRLVNFVKGDDPVGEHARHFPSCQFIQDLNNQPLSVLKWRSAKAVLMMEYSEAMVLTAINKCRMEGTEKPNSSQILDAIFELEQEKQQQVEAQMAAAGRIETDLNHGGYLSSGLKSDGPESEDLGSNVSNKSAPEVVKELRKKNEALKMSTTCKVCLNAEVNCVFLPCRHLVCCAECASKVEYCPVCPLQIIGTVKTFMA